MNQENAVNATENSEVQNATDSTEPSPEIIIGDSTEISEIVADASGTTMVENQPEQDDKKKPTSNAKLNFERFKTVRQELIDNGMKPSQRNILKRLGGSFSTIAKLERQLEMLESEPIDISVEVSDETIAAAKNDIRRHLEAYRDSVKEKLDRIEAAKNDMSEARETIQALQSEITELDAALTESEQIVAAINDKYTASLKETGDLIQALDAAKQSIAKLTDQYNELVNERSWLTGRLIESNGLKSTGDFNESVVSIQDTNVTTGDRTKKTTSSKKNLCR